MKLPTHAAGYPADARTAIDAQIEAIDEALHIRREIARRRTELLDLENSAESARNHIDKLQRRALDLAAQLSGART